MSKNAVGPILRRWRLERGISQEEIAARTGIKQNYYSAVECGRVGVPGPFKLYKILQVLGRTMDELMQEAEEAPAARLQPAACAA